jgi:hypothetical protein
MSRSLVILAHPQMEHSRAKRALAGVALLVWLLPIHG